MRNITPTYQVPSVFQSRIGAILRDGSKNKNRTNYVAVKDVLYSCFKSYNRNLVPMTLENLSPHAGFTPEQETTVRRLYESGAAEFDTLWDELKTLNGGKSIIFPICGVTFANELDHYVPRELFPEYSAHPQNIIPLCHDCNHRKLAKWTGANGVRLVFNAYYDTLPQNKILQCNINSIVNGLPWAEVDFCVIANPTSVDLIAKTTISELKLIDVYNRHINMDLATEIGHLQDEYSECRALYNSLSDFWNEKKRIYLSYLNHSHKYRETQQLLYEALTTSPVFDEWIIANI